MRKIKKESRRNFNRPRHAPDTHFFSIVSLYAAFSIFITFCLLITLNASGIKQQADYTIEDYLINYDSLNQTYDLMVQQKSTLNSQWDILCDEANKIPASISENKASYVLLDELLNRVKNKRDTLDNLGKYKQIFNIGGSAALTIYITAYDMYYQKNDFRAVNLFLFLINDKNVNKFTVGNSYYWLAVIFNDDLKNEEMAFKYYMMVHKYPACLVFTANSYIKAADILVNMFQIENPLALLAVDVPTYNYENVKCLRHLISANLCFNKRDYTNAVRHLQVVFFTNTNEMQRVQRSLKRCPNSKALWNTLLTNRWNENFMIKTIQNGISSPEETPDDDLFFDAITHDWPQIEKVSDTIFTNRTLSNNIFPQKRRKITKRRKTNQTGGNKL